MDSLDASLYPDILAAGGLIAAMELSAGQKGLDLGRLYSRYASGPGLFNSANFDSSRGRVSIHLGNQSRTFFVGIHERGFTWAEGATDGLDEIVEALVFWRDGISTDDFVERFSFVSLGRLVKAREAGDPTPAQWDWLRTAEEFTEERALVEAVHADGRFGRIFPNVSHGTLRLSFSHGRQGGREIRISPLPAGTYRVEDTKSPPPRIAASLREALDVAAAYAVP